MPLSDFVHITINATSPAISQAGFGVPLILSASASFSERVRYYNDLTGLVDDGFTSATPEHKAAAALFAQSPRPERVGIGRRANKPTQAWKVTPTVLSNQLYRLRIDGQDADYTSDEDATAAEICSNLKTAIDALDLGLTVTDSTTYLTIAADTAGEWHSVAADEAAGDRLFGSLFEILQNHADPGVDDDLDAILAENDEWYCVINPFNSKAEIETIAEWVESAKKLFIAQTQDSDVIGSGTSDVATALKDAGYVRTGLMFHPDNEEFADAAWAGSRLPQTPGGENWNFVTLAGVAAVQLNATHITNLKAKRCNWYYSVSGKNIVNGGGVSPANEYLDIVRGRDHFEARLGERFLLLLTGPKKIPFTDEGIALVEGAVRAQLQEEIANGFVAKSPTPVVSVPAAADVSSGDKAARKLTGVTCEATLAGAINDLTLTATLTV